MADPPESSKPTTDPPPPPKKDADPEDLSRHVSPGDILAAARAVFGGEATLVGDLIVRRATSSIQGYTSLMLRVTATVLPSIGETPRDINFIVKRLPLMEKQRDIMSSIGIMEREADYFTKAAPLLKNNVPNLPLVCGYVSHGTTIIMEDLCAGGFKTLGNNMRELGKEGLVDLPIAKMVMRKLATLHAASLDIDWLKIMPEHLEVDYFYEGKAKNLMESFIGSSANSAAVALSHFYPGKYPKLEAWLKSPHYIEVLRKLSKPNPKKTNVLGHGDFGIHNVMFKLEPDTKKVVDLKIIDLQVYRYASPCLDLFYFYYGSTDREFRKKHGEEMVEAYLAAFNTVACRTPDLYTKETFDQELDEHRLFGVQTALVRPMIFMENIFPSESKNLTPENVSNMMERDHSSSVIENLEKNPPFKKAIKDGIDDLIELLNKDCKLQKIVDSI